MKIIQACIGHAHLMFIYIYIYDRSGKRKRVKGLMHVFIFFFVDECDAMDMERIILSFIIKQMWEMNTEEREEERERKKLDEIKTCFFFYKRSNIERERWRLSDLFISYSYSWLK